MLGLYTGQNILWYVERYNPPAVPCLYRDIIHATLFIVFLCEHLGAFNCTRLH